MEESDLEELITGFAIAHATVTRVVHGDKLASIRAELERIHSRIPPESELAPRYIDLRALEGPPHLRLHFSEPLVGMMARRAGSGEPHSDR